eukprot:TRINITY_DN62248_c0_g1_i1.p1 TRINITY_DN62248_c0_g1~~TRINITY_DN62248_c0_g1_i1.p1  ORF type:complete len:850 (-),score=148.94 TRINITY_DN62248_c0_g1_i1:56-2605(-)
MKRLPTPSRAASSNADLLHGLNLQGPTELFSRLQDHLKEQARQDLFRRLLPELQAWQEHWDNDDDALEPEEPLTEDEVEVTPSCKRQRATEGFAAGPVEALWACDNEYYEAKIANTNVDGTVTVEWKDEWADESTLHNKIAPSNLRRPSRPDDTYPSHLWEGVSLKQGDVGFNQAAQAVYSEARWTSPSQGAVSLLPQQHFVTTMLHPLSRVARLLVDHSVGSGKTLILVRTVCNYYSCGKAVVVIMPKDCVVHNFYRSLWEWPSRWRDFACFQCPGEAAIAAGRQDWRSVRNTRWQINGENAEIRRLAETQRLSIDKVILEQLVKTMRETLELKGAIWKGKLRPGWVEAFWNKATDTDVHPPAAPLRCYRMTSAGGRASELSEGEPRGAIFKFGFSRVDSNPYSRKVVLMDEGHNLTRPSRMWHAQLTRLRNLLETAVDCTFMACTGSIAEKEIKDGRDLLNVIKGDSFASLSDEGFMSSYNKRGPSFPRQLPFGCADGEYVRSLESQFVKTVTLSSHALVRYVYQAIKLHRTNKSDDTLVNHTNLPVYFGSVGNSSSQREIMSGRPDFVPKFASVIADVKECAKSKQKCVIMVSRKTGYKTLVEILQGVASNNGFGIALYADLASFNSTANSRGEIFLALVLDADKEAESIDLKSVRRHLLVDVPPHWGAYKQRCGRSVRCGSHDNLPEDQRDVKFIVYCAVFADFVVRDPELGGLALWMFCGFWGGPKTINPSSEPFPEDIAEAVRGFVLALKHRGVVTIQELLFALRRDAGLAGTLLQTLGLENKLNKRLAAGLVELQQRGMQACPAGISSTIDERLLEKLRAKAEQMTPGMARLRCCAIDAGFY